MTKLSQETMVEYLNALQAVGTVTGAARLGGFSQMTASRWTRDSREAAKRSDDRSIYKFEYPLESGFVAYFHEHAKAATQATVADILQNALTRARDGTKIPALKDGQPVFLLNPEFEETKATREFETDLDLVINGFEPRWARDENFKKIPSIVVAAPSNEIVLGVLAAFQKRFSKKVNIDVNHTVTGGVVVAQSLESMTKAQLEQQLLPELEVIEGEASEIEEPSAEIEAPEAIEEPVPVVAPKPAPVAPAPAALSPLQQDLLRRARAKGIG